MGEDEDEGRAENRDEKDLAGRASAPWEGGRGGAKRGPRGDAGFTVLPYNALGNALSKRVYLSSGQKQPLEL